MADSLVLTAVLAAALLYVVFPFGQVSRAWSGFWLTLRPNFVTFRPWRATTQTFNLIVSAILVFGAVLIVWSAGAGIFRALWLRDLMQHAAGDKRTITDWPSYPCGEDCRNTVGFVVVEVVRAVGGVQILAIGAGMCGALLGFIFGIPRPLSAPDETARTQPQGNGNAQQRARKEWALSTNLTQVSDWLTKIIVGVGLVEATNAATAFGKVSNTMAEMLFNQRHGSPVLIPTAMIGSAIFGFMFAYLYTFLIVSRLIAAADRDLAAPSRGALSTIGKLRPLDERLVPRISRSLLAPDAGEAPTPDEIKAAFSIAALSLAELADADATAIDDIRIWARAKAVLNDYDAAAHGYIVLIGQESQ